MMNFDPFQMNYYPETDPFAGLTDEQRIHIAVKSVIGYIAAIFITLLVCALFGSCTTPKVIEQHHHHYYQADTLSTQAQADTHMTSTTASLDSLVSSLFTQYSASWLSHEDEKEVITETVTTATDSLGRQIRTEQRTTERNIARQQQQTEERLTQQFEERLQSAIQHQDSIWQLRYQQLQAHWEQSDSTSVYRGSPAMDNRPWYRRWWDNLRFILLGAAIATVLLFLKGIINFFKH